MARYCDTFLVLVYSATLDGTLSHNYIINIRTWQILIVRIYHDDTIWRKLAVKKEMKTFQLVGWTLKGLHLYQCHLHLSEILSQCEPDFLQAWPDWYSHIQTALSSACICTLIWSRSRVRTDSVAIPRGDVKGIQVWIPRACNLFLKLCEPTMLATSQTTTTNQTFYWHRNYVNQVNAKHYDTEIIMFRCVACITCSERRMQRSYRACIWQVTQSMWSTATNDLFCLFSETVNGAVHPDNVVSRSIQWTAQGQDFNSHRDKKKRNSS